MGLAGSLGAAGTLRLALCSFQYSRQCRSWEWMKRHMSQAWATHTSSSMPSLQTGREGSEDEKGGVGAAGPDPCSSCSSSPPQPLAPAPGRLCASVCLRSSTLQQGEVKAPRGWKEDGASYTLIPHDHIHPTDPRLYLSRVHGPQAGQCQLHKYCNVVLML